MEINLSDWKKELQKWAENNNSSVKIIKNAPVGDFRDYYTSEIKIGTNYKKSYYFHSKCSEWSEIIPFTLNI